MQNIPKLFMTTGALLALVGMGWGIEMSVTRNHSLAPAHAHLNLIGFVIMSLFGIYYALTPDAAASGLARAHYWLCSGDIHHGAVRCRADAQRCWKGCEGELAARLTLLA